MTSATDVSDQLAAIAAASNRLTAAWADRIEDGTSTVFSGAGVWPLLGLLGLGAGGVCRDELTAAFGLDPALAGSAARAFVDLFDRAPALRAAVGLWYRDQLPLRKSWLDELPPATRGRLTKDLKADKERLDAWAREHTDGLIEQMPVVLTPGTDLVLASAILVTTTWLSRFTETGRQVTAGPWSGRTIPALARQTPPNALRVVDGDPEVGQVTAVVVEGENDIDVVLFLGGPDVAAAKVLRTGITAVGASGGGEVWPGAQDSGLLAGGAPDRPLPPGVSVETTMSTSPEPTALLTTPRFTVRAEHDLLADAQLFGLTAASDASTADFTGMSPQQLVVGSARQNAMAEFSATGFKAAAVTAIAMTRAAMMRPRHEALRIDVVYDRPFGFAALHRPSGLVIAAGWVADV